MSCPFPHSIRDGVTIPPFITPDRLQQIEEKFVPRKGDIFIATYPKSGTTWVSYIVNQLLDEPQGHTEKIVDAVPWLQDCDINQVLEMKSPRVIKTHDLWRWVPKSDMLKFIFCYRNPKDVCCSYYHHINYFSNDYQYSVPFSQYFDDVFTTYNGAEYGSYFEFHKEWFEQLGNPQILFINYEDMVENLVREVKKIAQFLKVEICASKLETIVSSSTFKSMSQNKYCDYSWDRGAGKNGKFLRKGKVGSWRDEMTQDQSFLVEKMAKEKLEDAFDIKFRYSLDG